MLLFILKMPEWLGISNMSNASHTLANWEWSFQHFGNSSYNHMGIMTSEARAIYAWLLSLSIFPDDGSFMPLKC